MSNTRFIEAVSADPFVRELHRKAVRLLNDPSLDRQQREAHIRRLQRQLVEHQAKEAEKAQKKAAKTARREQATRQPGSQSVADTSQVVARRQEFRQVGQEGATAPDTLTGLQGKNAVAANDGQATGRRRPVLTLKRA